MSVSDSAGPLRTDGWRLVRRMAVALTALALVAGFLGWMAWIAGHALAPQAPPKNPFGAGLREAAPSGSIGEIILSVQSTFYRALTQGLQGLKDSGSGLWALLGIGFAYGVFHAAGPGHGKGVISGYLMANERTLVKGLGLSFAAALLQAVVAITIVAVLSLALRATAATVSATTNAIELASFALVALVGFGLLWRKADKFSALAFGRPDAIAAACGADCDHAHMPTGEEADRAGTVREWLGVVVAAGARPCSGAIILLVFALSQGAFAAGIGATLAMALGTALTTGLIAAIAVFAKALALRLAGGRGQRGEVAMAGIEVLAAAFVTVLGGALLVGLWSAGAG